MRRTVMTLGVALGLAACGEGDADEPAPPLECGEETCASGEYCRETSGGVAATFGYDCQPLPEGCDSCDCVPEGDFCEETAAGLKVSIPLP